MEFRRVLFRSTHRQLSADPAREAAFDTDDGAQPHARLAGRAPSSSIIDPPRSHPLSSARNHAAEIGGVRRVAADGGPGDRTSVVSGQRESVRVELVVRVINKKKTNNQT